jgi:hypothetical protein
MAATSAASVAAASQAAQAAAVAANAPSDLLAASWAAFAPSGAATSTFTGSLTSKSFSRQSGAGLRGVRTKLTDIGIAPATGTIVSVEMTVGDVIGSPEPFVAGAQLIVGSCNSSIASPVLGTSAVVAFDVAAAVSPSLPPGSAPLAFTLTLPAGHDSIFIAGNVPGAAPQAMSLTLTRMVAS